jgi:hypothetical protein
MTRIGLGWRPEVALLLEQEGIQFTEVVAENFWKCRSLTPALRRLRENGATIIPHGVSLALASADRPDDWRLEKLGNLAMMLDAPYVSEHIAFVRGGGYESGHLLPLERNNEMLEIVIENVQYAQKRLPVPLVLENIATVVDWQTSAMSEAQFIACLVQETGARLLLDVSNLHANCHNHSLDYVQFLDTIPLDSVAYVHMAGGVVRGKLYHDTHAHPLTSEPLRILQELCSRVAPPAVLLERDDAFDDLAQIKEELRQIRSAIGSVGQAQVAV